MPTESDGQERRRDVIANAVPLACEATETYAEAPPGWGE